VGLRRRRPDAEPQHYWWDVMFLMRRLILCLCAVIFKGNYTAQAVAAPNLADHWPLWLRSHSRRRCACCAQPAAVQRSGAWLPWLPGGVDYLHRHIHTLPIHEEVSSEPPLAASETLVHAGCIPSAPRCRRGAGALRGNFRPPASVARCMRERTVRPLSVRNAACCRSSLRYSCFTVPLA
jgi:hypothetical protein